MARQIDYVALRYLDKSKHAFYITLYSSPHIVSVVNMLEERVAVRYVASVTVGASAFVCFAMIFVELAVKN